MKKLFITMMLAAGVFAAHAQTGTPTPQQKEKANPNGPRFKFTEETHDFGTLKEGPVAEYVFKFKNVGKEPLIIQGASASCGCTTPDWPKQPILPGKEGEIKVQYNTSGRVGPFTKTVFISSNAVSDKDRYEIYIKGTVVAAEKKEDAAK